jgi:hypothetical protein
MNKTVLRSDLRDKILTDVILQVEIHKASGRTIESIKRWARENSELLLLSPVTDAIRSTLKLPKSESLTETVLIPDSKVTA